jgi:hypothetical protein
MVRVAGATWEPAVSGQSAVLVLVRGGAPFCSSVVERGGWVTLNGFADDNICQQR